jgi:hypothetical protein
MEAMEGNGDPEEESLVGDLGAPMDDGEKEEAIIPGNPDMAWWNMVCWLAMIVIALSTRWMCKVPSGSEGQSPTERIRKKCLSMQIFFCCW